MGTANEWNAVLNILAMTDGYKTVPFSTTPAFTSSGPITVFDMTLTGNVVSSTLTAQNGILVFFIRQDATGGRTFAWPANVSGGALVGSEANPITTQMFTFDGTNATDLGPAVIS